MITPRIKALLEYPGDETVYTVQGWVRAFRSNRFIELNDGSCQQNLQLVIDFEQHDAGLLKRITTGSALQAHGKLVTSMGKGQRVELHVSAFEVLGTADPELYPLQPKKHSLEFLRDIAHLRPRTNTFGAVFRIRHSLAFAIHKFFNERGFYYFQSPIITASDAEGAGEMFRVTTQQAPGSLEKNDFSTDFFGRSVNLTVSGQLEAELGAMGLGNVYTFGPTFRAENSNTARHLAEFWMIEPEMAFYDLHDNMQLAESLLVYLIRYILEQHPEELAFLEQRLLDEEKQKPQHERSEMRLTQKLEFCTTQAFERVSYTEAIEILKFAAAHKKKKFQFPVNEWGIDLQSEHERYLVEQHFKKPVILYNYPKAIKSFYMRQNDDGKTVAAMDILFPGIGEMVGGSQREERYEHLSTRMKELSISETELYWYLDTRKFGSCPHSGFGLGFERMVQFVTGMANIRDVIPFPRTPKNCMF